MTEIRIPIPNWKQVRAFTVWVWINIALITAFFGQTTALEWASQVWDSVQGGER